VRQYVQMICEADVSKAANAKRRRDSNKIRRIMESFARNVATEASIQSVIADARGAEATVADGTAIRYIDVLRDLMIVENCPAFNTHIRSSASLRQRETKHFVDPSIAAACLGLSPARLLDDLNYMGYLFESLAVRDLRVYAQHCDASVFHYRDSRGLEADAIVRRADGAWAAFEIKLGKARHDEAAQHLLKLQSDIDVKKAPGPASLNIVTGFGFAHTRPDGVNVIPLSELGY